MTGSTLGAVETIANKNPIYRFLYKVIEQDDVPEPSKVGEKISTYAEKADMAINELTGDEKGYLRSVSEGLGSSIPFIAGGLALNLFKIPSWAASLGLSSVESIRDSHSNLSRWGRVYTHSKRTVTPYTLCTFHFSPSLSLFQPKRNNQFLLYIFSWRNWVSGDSFGFIRSHSRTTIPRGVRLLFQSNFLSLQIL
jgi:hypothetical protein